MPLAQATLATKIKNEIQLLYGVADDPAKLDDFAQALAKAVVDEIQQNAVVTVTSVSGVTPGGGVSGPGAGTVG